MLKKSLQFPVIYQEDPDGGFIATVVNLPGCHTQGETVEEAEENIKEAIGVYLECWKADRSRIQRTNINVFLGSVMVNS